MINAMVKVGIAQFPHFYEVCIIFWMPYLNHSFLERSMKEIEGSLLHILTYQAMQLMMHIKICQIIATTLDLQ